MLSVFCTSLVNFRAIFDFSGFNAGVRTNYANNQVTQPLNTGGLESSHSQHYSAAHDQG